VGVGGLRSLGEALRWELGDSGLEGALCLELGGSGLWGKP